MLDQSPTSVSAPPPKPTPRRFVVRVAMTSSGQAVLTEKDGKREKLVMYTPFERVRPRLRSGETVAFFWAEMEDGILDLGERAPSEKEWDVYDPKSPPRLPPGPLSPSRPSQARDRCPCGAPTHKEMCRDAIAAMNGRRFAGWKAPGMEHAA